MRTKTMLLTAAALTAGFLTAYAQTPVYSLNVVGYVNRILPGPSIYSIVANPLDDGAGNWVTNVLRPLPSGTVVLLWNGAGYNTGTRQGFGVGWNPSYFVTNALPPGLGAFVKTTSSGPWTNTFSGTVMQGWLTNAFVSGYQLMGNMVPDTGTLTNGNAMQLTNIPASSQLLIWNETPTGGFTIFSKQAFGTGWSASPGIPSLTNVAQGYFLRAQTAFSWVRNFTVQ